VDALAHLHVALPVAPAQIPRDVLPGQYGLRDVVGEH